ncbi:hypothetical protein NB701_004273 [Pantoea ananatis]|nr:hypothetical protein [Pantoea ananatis]
MPVMESSHAECINSIMLTTPHLLMKSQKHNMNQLFCIQALPAYCILQIFF